MTTETKIRDTDLTDEAIKRVAAERVERGLAWLDENAPEGYVFGAFKLPNYWPFCDEKPYYIANEGGIGIEALLGLAFTSKTKEILRRGYTIENYPTASAVQKFLSLPHNFFHELGLSSLYNDDRMKNELNRLWEAKMRERLVEELHQLFHDRKHGRI